MCKDLTLPCLSLSEFRNSAMKRFLNVFNYPCPLTSPFTPQMDARLIVFNETQPINTDLLKSIISVSKNMGEDGFYFSFVETDNYQIFYPGMQDEIYLKSWFIPFEDIKEYQAQYFLTHHVVYSQQGNWGVFVGYDDFLMLGGISEFTTQITAMHPEFDNETVKFLQTWREWNQILGYKIEWIPKSLEHIYGVEKAEKLVKKYLWDLM